MKRYQQSGRRPAIYEDYFAPLSGGDAGKKIRLDSLRPYQTLNIDKFLSLLNKRAAANKRSGVYTPLPSVSEILRGWVDEWLDSGRDKTGAESPMWRSFKRAQKCGHAAVEYLRRARVGFLPDEGGLLLSFLEYKEPSTEPLRPLIDTRNEDYAREQLVFFLLSQVRFMLAKCRKKDCGTYFLLRHWNRQYKGGTLCNSCKRSRSQDSAVKATAEVRKNAASQLHQLAAKRFSKRILSIPDWHKQPELKGAIAEYLNRQIERSESLRAVYLNGKREGVTGKWVARSENWNGIETALKGGK
jgi:hypothetical protein